MAHTLSITDGTTTVTLSQANGYLIEDEELGTDENADFTVGLDEPRIDSTFDMLLLAAVGSMQTLARAVETLLVAGKRRQLRKEGPRVYLQLQVHGEASAWRAEIVDGRFKPQKPLVNWFSNAVPYSLMVTHRAWEGPRTEIQIGTSALSAATGGRAITQKNNDHYLTVAASQVGGSLPAYLELQLTNTSGSAINFRNYYIGVSDYGNFTSWIEGEDRVTGYGTVTSDSGCSGSPARYNAYSFTDTGTIQWDLSSSLMGATEGRRLKMLCRFFSLTGTGLYIRPILRDSTGVLELTRAAEETYIGSANSRLMDLGTMAFPPGGYNSTPAATRLELAVRATGAGSANVDYFFLMPLDTYMHIAQRGLNIPNSTAVIFDCIEDIYHVGNSMIFSRLEGRLKLKPGVAQRVYILADEGSSTNVARTFTARAYIRERRLTI